MPWWQDLLCLGRQTTAKVSIIMLSVVYAMCLCIVNHLCTEANASTGDVHGLSCW